MTLWLLAPLALGAVPTTVRPVLAPDDAPAQYAAWAAAERRAAEPLACEPVWPDEVLVCFTVVEGSTRRWVDAGDLGSWGVDLAALVETTIDRARAPLADRPRATAVEDMPATYYVSAEGDGWDAALLLRPEWITARVGGTPVLVAAPVAGTVLAWRPGSASLDKVMAVGARKMFEAGDGVSAVVHLWDGETWQAYGEALPTSAPESAEP